MTRAVRRLSLTEANVRKLPVPPKGKKEYTYDTELRRLALASYSSGIRTWKFIYAVPAGTRSRTRSVTLGNYEDLSLALARKKATQLGGMVAEGRDPASERKEERNADTVATLAARYLTKARTKNKAWEHSEYLLDKYVLPKWRHRPVNMIKRADVIALLEPLENRWALHNQVRSTIHAMFAFGESKDIVAANPVRGTEPCEAVIKERVLSDEEVVAFWLEFHLLPAPSVAS